MAEENKDLKMINKIISFIVISLFFVSSVFGQCPAGGGVFVNEIYNEGNTEFVELVVIGDPANPLDPVDLSGWIVDDNNIAMAGQGTAPGYLILDGSFSNVAPGTIILINDEHNPYAPLPAANPWLIIVDGSDLDGCVDVPNSSDANYSPCGSSGSDYNSIIFNNNHDIIQTRFPDESYYHAVVFIATVDGDVSPYADITDKSSSLNCGDWFDGGNWDALAETPGEPNSPENELLINAIRNGTLDCDNIDLACSSPCPLIDDIEIINSPVCDYEDFIVRATGLANMGQAANGDKDFGINFVSFLGSTSPADPYSGGTSIANVVYGDLTGTDPDQEAEATISGGTLSAGTYTICAILLETSVNGCDPSQCEVIEIFESPEASLDGESDFCPGDCHEINTIITKGVEPYDASFTLSIGSFNVPFTIPAYDTDNELTICYSGTIAPYYDSGSNIFYVPTSILGSPFTGSGTITLTGLIDNNGCEAQNIDPDFMTLNFKESLDIFPIGPLEECDDDFDGKAEFDLTIIEGDLGTGTANWFSDSDCNNSISSPYETGSTTVYVFLTDADKCNSDTIPIVLTVIEYPNPGENNDIETCNTENCLDFDSNLGPDHDPDGVWDDMDASGVSLDDPECVSFEDIDFGTYRYSFTTEDPSGTCSKTVILTIEVAEPGEAGASSSDIFCGAPEDLIDLNSYLSPSADNNGTWYDSNGYEENSSIDLSDESPGVFVYTYVVENEPCAPDDATITLTIISVNAGNDAEITICNGGSITITDFNTAIGEHDPDGDWVDLDDSGVNISNPDVVDFKDFGPDTFHYLYHLPEEYPCLADSAIVTVIVKGAPFAGNDGANSICIGSLDTINLFNYLGQNYDNNGFWSQVGGNPVDISKPDTMIFSNEPVGVDSFLYITSGICGKDSAFVFIDITASPNAGDDYNNTICQNETINLFDSLKNYNVGGTWYDSDWNVVLNSDNLLLTDLKTYKFYYVLPENGTCSSDTAVAFITTQVAPEAGIGKEIILCQSSSESFNLFDYLTGNNQNNGIWKDPNNNTIANPNNYSFNSFPLGESTIKYFLNGNGFCDGDSAIVKITITEPQKAGTDNTFTVCNGEINNLINIDSLLGTHDTGGNWTNIDNAPIISGNWKSVSFTDVAEGSYKFEYKLNDNGICPGDQATITIFVTKKISAGIDKELTFCEGASNKVSIIDELKPDVTLAYIIEDVEQSGAFDTSTKTIDISLLSKNKYTYKLITGDNDLCGTDTSVLTINIVDALNAGSDNSIIVCNDESTWDLDALLGTHDLGGNWIDKNGSGVNVQSTNGKSVSFKNVPKGNYTFEYKIESSSCPVSSALISVTVNAATESNISKTLCPGQIIHVGNNDYSTDNPTGIEEFTNSVGCDSLVHVQIQEKSISSSISFNDENCFGAGKFILDNMNNSTLPVTLKIEGLGDYQVSSFPYEITDIPAGNYKYTIVDNDGCSSDINENFVIDKFIPYTIKTTVSSSDKAHVINVITNINPEIIGWTPPTSLSCTNCLNPVATPNEDTKYIVIIRDKDGCEVSDTIFLNGIIDEDVDIYIPNIFTPDGDGKNDKFYVSSDIENAKYSMYIFDRWGEKLYFADDLEFNDSTRGWDGTFKGKKLNTAVFVYMITIKYDNSERKDIISGDLLIAE